MLELVDVHNKLVMIEEFDRMNDVVYVYNEIDDLYYVIKDIRIDSEDDIVIDICEDNYK